MISRLNDITSKSEELEGLLSEGLLKPPIKNCISLMTTSGAKGGVVSFMHAFYICSEKTINQMLDVEPVESKRRKHYICIFNILQIFMR